jgi:DNA polymerase-3 subunit alpha
VIAGLHAHGEYSLLDGAGTAKQHVAAAKEAGYLALALTDHGTLAGALHHMRACREGGIMPIVGSEVYYRPNRKVQGQKDWLKVYYHLTLHAKDERGWHNLMAIVSEAHRSGFYGRACVDDELLERYHEGLICLSGCIGGRLCKSIIQEHDREAEAWLRQLKRWFGDDLFLEIMPHDLDEQRTANIEVARMAQHHGLPLVATLDEHYPTADWADVQDALLMIATNQTIKKREKKREEGEDVYEFTVKTLYHQTAAEVAAEFARNHPQISGQVVQEAIRNTLYAAGRTTPFLVDTREKMPAVPVPEGITPEDQLRRLCYEGLQRRGYITDPEYTSALDFELETFSKRGQTNYMLLVADVVMWAKSRRPVPKRVKGQLVYDSTKKPIMVGPGRGSAAGSVAAWALGITNLNPKKYRTLFERFVNPNRVGLPDIDLDFPPDRVDEVEDYIKAVHGKDKVVDIIAHSTFGPRAAVTDVGRVLSIPYDHVKAATKLIDDQERGSLEDIRRVNPPLNRLAEQHPDAWEIMKLIQGQVARKSEHAGGVLILPDKVDNFIPVERTGGQKGKLLSAYGERSGKGNALISELNLIKLDVLRVAELTKQQHAIDLIAQRTGEVIDLDALPIHDDPYAADPRVMQGFKDGLLVGIFQFSATAAKLTRQLKPDNVLDLALINAGIRPGPRGVGADQRAARRKNRLEPITYWHPSLEPFLDYTYGEMFFQEQLIEVVHHLGGLTRANADIFRKIASKLYRDPDYAREVMGEWEVPIKASMREKGLDDHSVDVVWQNLLSFSDYSFNLAHAAGYAVLAYRDMWLKVYHPREFYAAFLSRGLSQVTKKKALQKQEAAREMRSLPTYITTVPYKILPPDIHQSGRDYTVVDEGIRLGLEAIKNIGPAAASAIEEHRPFVDYQDFERRVPAKAVNIVGKGSLVMAGAFDLWGMRRDFTEERIDVLERELLGMSLTSVHSIQRYSSVIEGRFWTEEQVEAAPDGTRVTVMGEVVGIKEHADTNGNMMCFIDLAYGPNQWNCTVFSYLYAEYEELIKSRRPLMITGIAETYVNKDKGIERRNIKVESLPADAEGNLTPPIMDIEDYVAMIADIDESLASDSVYVEDLAEWRGDTEQTMSPKAFAALVGR